MTHDVQAIRDDLAFMRALAQEGRRAPLLIGHNLMVGGVALGTTCLVCWAIAAHVLALPRWWEAGIWAIVTPLYMFYCYVRRTQWRNAQPGATAITNRAVQAAWRGVGYSLLILAVATGVAAYQMKTMAPFGLFPSIIMAFYGLGWMVAAAMSETKWLHTVSVASFIMAVLLAFVSDTKAGYVVMAAALYLLMALPGWLLTRPNRRMWCRGADVMDGFDIDQIDEVIHGRVRLGVMAYLSSAEMADFNTLKSRLQVTDGNLSVHLRKLEDAGYVGVEKSFVGRKPLTQVRVTPEGQAAFLRYLDAIGKLVGDAVATPAKPVAG